MILYDCCPPSCYTFAFDGLSAAASHTAPPVFFLPNTQISAGVTALFTRFPTGYSLDRVYRNETATVVVAEVLTAEKLVLTTEEFNCRQ